MKNDNFTVQSSLEGNYLKVELQEPVRLDEIVMNVVRRDCPEFLIPFTEENINGSTSLKYKLINAIALEYANMTFRKAEFIGIFQSLIVPFITGNDWFLDYHNFCVDARYIYLDRQTNMARFIYIPEDSYQNTDEEILQFFKEIFIRMTITDDANFQVRLYQYFSGRNVTLAELFQLILDEGKKMGYGAGMPIQSGMPPVGMPAQSGMPPVGMPAQPGMPPVGMPTQSGMPPVGMPTQSGMPPVGMPAQSGMPPVGMPAQSGMQPAGTSGGMFSRQDAKAADKGKAKGSMFSGGIGKKGKDGTGQEEPSHNDTSRAPLEDPEEVVNALFGNNKKKGKEKPAAAEKQDKKKGGSFGLFGKKKEQNGQAGGNTAMNMAAAPNPPEWAGMPGFGAAMPANGTDDKTEIFSDDFQAAAYLELIDSPIPGAFPRIELDFTAAYITIGRASSDEVQPDVAFGREFTRIGRRHARIEQKDGDYYVIDLGSANHTMLNGHILVPNQPYRLQDGGELAFTDSKPVRYRIHL